MLKILKHFKPYLFSILFIISLLVVQAFCDLALPDYMSDIVNIGIQQGGIANAVPDTIRKSEADRLTLFMSEENKKVFYDSYDLFVPGDVNQKDYVDYVKDYPLLSTEPLYILKPVGSDKINQLDQILAKPMIIVFAATDNRFGDLFGKSSSAPVTKEALDSFSNLPQEIRTGILNKIDEMLAPLSQSMITQSAIEYIKVEYKAIGIDTNKLQVKYLILSGLKMLGVALLSMTATIFVALTGTRVAAGLGRDLRSDVFKKVESFSSVEFDKFSTASLITRTTNDIQQVQIFTVMLLRIVFYAPILGFGGVLKVLSTRTNMGWVIAVSVFVIMSIVIIMFSIAIPKFRIVQKLVDKLNLVTRENLTGLMVIRAFNTQKHEEERFDKANMDLTKTNLFINRTMSLMMPLMMLLMNCVSLLIIWVGAHRVDSGAMQVGDIMAFISYAMQIIVSFLMISMVSIMLPRASVSAERIAEVLDVEPSIKDPETKKLFDPSLKGQVEFKDVSFRYPGADDCVLEDISFIVERGKTTAFIGSTGSGKSTLINLIPRFYDVTKGQVIVDGQDVREVSLKELRDKIGYIPQKGVLFSGTVKSNLLYGIDSGSIEKEDEEKILHKAAEISQALGFIQGMPEGFNAPVSQGGTNVSGGQKQRLSIARALVKNPEIYIFDDSFSALDYKTDSLLRKALKSELGDSTLIIVAQRISTIMDADQIIVLDKGRIAGSGTHKELLENCEVYREIASSQLSKEELAI
ncbi:MAG: ABC transporter ATP-binding protein [Clostridiaceae bacterium]|jgi:ATP-binding cassette subfamily B multidrug efflux pump|nr:ABC transporter ATP-binding protein [Clostridiaceae bacterium]